MNALHSRSAFGGRFRIGMLLAGAAVGGAAVAAAPAATSLARHVVAAGGGRSTSPGLAVHGTIGQSITGLVTGPGYRLHVGFWPGPGVGSPGPTSTAPTSSPTASVTPGGTGEWTVNTTDDNDDGTCDAAHCSLREALNQNLWHVGPDTIRFAIPAGDPGCDAGGVCAIRPAMRLPELLDGRTTIDGFTQAGARPNSAPFGQPIDAVLRIVLDGAGLPESERYAPGLDVRSSDNVIRGLVVHGYNTGIDVIDASGNRIEGNFVGTDATGLTAPGNRCIGVALGGHEGGAGSARNVIGGTSPSARNLIAGNGCNGVSIGPSGDNDVQGNYLGTDATGSRALPNEVGGVRVHASIGNRIGSAGDGEANLVAFNETAGVIVSQHTDPANRNRISRNRIHSNDGPGIVLEGGANAGILPPVIDSAAAFRATGTACAGCVVEVFSDAGAEGAHFEGAAIADASGRWTLDRPAGFAGPNLTATATDGTGNTSAFAPPVALPRPTPSVSATRTPTSGTPATPGPSATGPMPTGPTPSATTPAAAPTPRASVTPGGTPQATPPGGAWTVRLPWVALRAEGSDG